jgi:hypothetical protein
LKNCFNFSAFGKISGVGVGITVVTMVVINVVGKEIVVKVGWGVVTTALSGDFD